MQRLPLVLGLLAALVIPRTLIAGTIVFFDENRQLNANAASQFYGDSGFWSSSLTSTTAGGGRSTASQTTNISDSFVGGSGLAEVVSPSSGARSLFGTHFTIDEPTSRTWTSSCSNQGWPSPGFSCRTAPAPSQ
jgi:hypothetical protein